MYWIRVRWPHEDFFQAMYASGAEMSSFLEANSLLISAPKSSVTLFTPETKQPVGKARLPTPNPLNRSPKILGAHLDITKFQRPLQESGNSHKEEEHLERVGRRNVGSTKGNPTDDI